MLLEVHAITVGNRESFSVKMINVQNKLGIKNIFDLVRKNIKSIFKTKNPTKKQKEISKKPTDDSNTKYARNDLMKNITKKCRGVKQYNDGINRMEKEEQRESFSAILGFKEHNIMLTKEQSKSVKVAFEGENMQTQDNVLGYRIDLYFHDYNLAIEVDEKDHKDKNIDHEIKRQTALEKN